MNQRTETELDANRFLLEMVLKAVDMPEPATLGDAERHAEILVERVRHVRLAILGALADTRAEDITWRALYLSDQVAENPADYQAWGQR